jgi:hypothetical protein
MKYSAVPRLFKLLVPLAIPVVVLLVLFDEALFSPLKFFPPSDGAPFFKADFTQTLLNAHWGSWSFRALGGGHGGIAINPVTFLLGSTLPPLAYHVGRYMLDVLLLWVGAAYLLRGRRLRGIGVYAAATAFAFSGYVFTLVSAGHARVFDSMAMAVLMIAFADRGISRASPFHLAMAGLCAGFGINQQPDVMGLFILLGSFYGLFLLVPAWARNSQLRTRKAFLIRLTAGIVLGLAAFGCLAISGMDWTKTAMASRDAVRGKTPEQKWEYATNWSMPPEEVLEFVAPHVYGVETRDPRGPYWGRLGRALRWGETRQGLVNLKQHSLYLGVFPLLFALYAVIRSRKRNWCGAMSGDGDEAYSLPGDTRSQVLFWGVAFLVTVLLAMGRFFTL